MISCKTIAQINKAVSRQGNRQKSTYPRKPNFLSNTLLGENRKIKMQFHKPSIHAPLDTQDDHNRRMADISFRHLTGAWENHNKKQQHKWVKNITNEDPAWGKGEYLTSRTHFNAYESEEYTQAMASTIFSHVWLLSVANYYRLSCNNSSTKGNYLKCESIINKTSTPQAIATELNLPKNIISYAEKLHNMRNTIMHLVEGDKKTAPITSLDFKSAYMFSKATWVIFCAILRNYGIRPDRGSWRIQTNLYSLPHNLNGL